MSAPASSFTPKTAAHVFITDREPRKIKTNHQQLTHVINRMLSRLEIPDKATRAANGIHGLLNGREVLGAPSKFPVLMAHKYAARQMGFNGQDANCDQFMCRVLTALAEAEQKCGRKLFEIKRADGVTQIITSYEADYIGEAALWALTEAQASDEWKKNPAKAVTDELIDLAIAKLPERPLPPERDTSDGASITDAAIIKGMWTKVDTLAEAAMRRVALAGGDPLTELQEVQRRHRRIAVEIQRERLEHERKEQEAAYYKTVDWLADTPAQGDELSLIHISEPTRPY